MSDTKITIGPVRFSYCNVWKPRKANDDGKEKYSVSIIIDKSDKKTKKKIDRAIQAAIDAGEAILKGKKNIKKPLRDGDTDREGDGAYEGTYFLNANSDNQPGILDSKKEEILDQKDFYSGCYGFVSVNFFAYNRKGNAGVGVGLNHLMKSKDGEPLNGRGSAEDDFADITIDDDDSDDDEGSEFF
jgi:hypothetical protein